MIFKQFMCKKNLTMTHFTKNGKLFIIPPSIRKVYMSKPPISKQPNSVTLAKLVSIKSLSYTWKTPDSLKWHFKQPTHIHTSTSLTPTIYTTLYPHHTQYNTSTIASVEPHGVQTTICMASEPGPSRGIPC